MSYYLDRGRRLGYLSDEHFPLRETPGFASPPHGGFAFCDVPVIGFAICSFRRRNTFWPPRPRVLVAEGQFGHDCLVSVGRCDDRAGRRLAAHERERDGAMTW